MRRCRVWFSWFLLAIVVTAMTGFVACGFIGGSASVPDNPEELILEDALVVSDVDFQAIQDADDLPYPWLRSDEDARDYQERMEDDWDDAGYSFDTDIEDVESVLTVRIRNGEYHVVKGELDFVDIRDELEDRDFEEDTYRGFEFWLDDYNSGVALFEEAGIYIVGRETEVEDVIKAIERGEGLWRKTPISGALWLRRETGW